MQWEKKEISSEQVKDISSKYGCSLLTASVLARRGITTGDSIQFFLEDDLRFLHNPFEMHGMEDAVERILAAKDEGEKVLVFGDSDVDGITGTALLAGYLNDIGLDVSWRIPAGDEPYGLSKKAVEEFAEDYGTLIITVDCGISCLEEIQLANELSVDVIITDHHDPQEDVPDALAIVNPKMGYPWKYLSGCGVAYKLVSALRFAHANDLYGQPMCLLNTRPVNEAWIIEVAKMRNLAVIETMTETVVPGMMAIGDTRLPAFLEGQQILVWDAPVHKQAITRLFGTGVEIGMLDIAGEIGREIPSVAGKSLIRIRELSTLAKYAVKEVTELDVLISLFCSFVRKKNTANTTEELYALQLAALGTIGDIMPLQNENRIIVRNGFKSLSPDPAVTPQTGPRPGIAELLDKLELSGKHYDIKDISWKICPVINAGRRMGNPYTAADLFFAQDPVQREKLAGELVGMNEQRKHLEGEVWNKFKPMADKSLEDFDGKLSLVYGQEINKGVTGLIAQRIARLHNVPAIAVCCTPVVYTGSIRSARNYNISSLLEQCSDLFIDCGGHEFAGGFSLVPNNWDSFTDRLANVVHSIEFDESPDDNILRIDAELPPGHLTPDIFDLVDRFEPYGKDNEPLTFLAKNLIVEDIQFIGKDESKHLKMVLNGGKHKWPALYWNAANRVISGEFGKGDRIDAVFNLSRDWFKGIATEQMIICDVRKCS